MRSLILMIVLTNFILVSSIYDPFDDTVLYEVSYSGACITLAFQRLHM